MNTQILRKNHQKLASKKNSKTKTTYGQSRTRKRSILQYLGTLFQISKETSLSRNSMRIWNLQAKGTRLPESMGWCKWSQGTTQFARRCQQGYMNSTNLFIMRWWTSLNLGVSNPKLEIYATLKPRSFSWLSSIILSLDKEFQNSYSTLLKMMNTLLRDLLVKDLILTPQVQETMSSFVVGQEFFPNGHFCLCPLKETSSIWQISYDVWRWAFWWSEQWLCSNNILLLLEQKVVHRNWNSRTSQINSK